MGHTNNVRKYLELADDIQIKIKLNQKTPDQLLTEEEIDRLIEVAKRRSKVNVVSIRVFYFPVLQLLSDLSNSEPL